MFFRRKGPQDVRKRRVWGRERPGGTLKPWYIIGPEE